MNRYALMMVMISLVACKDKGDDTGGGGGGGGVGDECEVTVKSTEPADGATDAYYRQDIEFVLSEKDDTATFSVSSSDGEVTGTQWTSEDGKTVYFTPSSPLAPSTSYTATLTTCAGEPSISFTTSSLGTAASCDPTGATYLVALNEARFVEPAALGDLIGEYLEEDVLLGVEEVGASTIKMIGAVAGEGGGQDFCDPTIPFPEADFSEAPYFIVGPEDTTLTVAGYSIPINDLMLSGTIAADCSYFGGGILAGQLDARDLGALVGEFVGTEDPDELCGLLAGFSVTCEACSDGQNYCVSIVADQIKADAVPELTLECVAELDCHPSCADSAANPECDTSDYPVCE